MRAFINGIGWAGARGLGRAGQRTSIWEMGETPIPRMRDLFENPEGRSGRLDDFSRLGLAAAALAVCDAGWPEGGARRPVALVASSQRGCLPTDAEYYRTVMPQGGKFASPNLFAYTLPNCFLGEAAIRFALTGPALVLTGGGPFEAIETGLGFMSAGEAEAAVCGWCDLPSPAALDLPEGVGGGALFAVIEKNPGENTLGEITLNCGLLTIKRGRTSLDPASLDEFTAFCLDLEHHP